MTKKAVLINDLSGLGKCSLTAAIPVLSVMGIQACPMPTAVLTSQTGFKSFYCNDCTDKLDYYTSEWKKRYEELIRQAKDNKISSSNASNIANNLLNLQL